MVSKDKGETTMTTQEFLAKELSEMEASLKSVSLGFQDMVAKAVAGGMREHDAVVAIEAVHRELKARRDFLRELLAKAAE